MDDKRSTCVICGEPMPRGEEMFKFHGYSGDCPAPPISRDVGHPLSAKLRARWQSNSSAVIDGGGGVYHGQLCGEASILIAEAAAEIDRLSARRASVESAEGALREAGAALARLMDALGDFAPDHPVLGYARGARQRMSAYLASHRSDTTPAPAPGDTPAADAKVSG